MIKLKNLFTGLCLFLLSCNSEPGNTNVLQARIDSLEQQIEKSYKPGFGEFMSSIQVHHEKLWFAGVNKNWKLADFEITEIKESLDDLKIYCTDRPEIKNLSMIDPAIDSIGASILEKNDILFKNNFITLTNTCNNCHKATTHEFNVIKIPDTPPFSNQVFTTAEDKK